MDATADLKQLPGHLRRRNRRLAWIITAAALACALSSYWAVTHGWIYPEETTFAFPSWMK